MPVRKFRSIEDMNRPVWHQPGDPALYRAMAVVWDFSRRANPRRFPPGVLRFPSADAMRQYQKERDAEHVADLRKRRS
jgi:hypothetical protein